MRRQTNELLTFGLFSPLALHIHLKEQRLFLLEFEHFVQLDRMLAGNLVRRWLMTRFRWYYFVIRRRRGVVSLREIGNYFY